MLNRFLIAKLGELERELETVAGKIVCSQPEAVRSCIPDTRRFVEVRQRDLRKLLNSEPRIARAAIGKHVQKITLTSEGRAFIASGSWDLLGEGGVAVRWCRGPGMDRTSAGSFRVVGRGMSPKRTCLDWISGRLADA